MSDNIFWTVEGTIKEGELDNFNAVINELIEATNNEPNTLNYEWFMSEDDKSFYIYERYADSAAAMTHLAGFATFAEQFMATCEVKRIQVYGNPNEETKNALMGSGATFAAPIGGFAR